MQPHFWGFTKLSVTRSKVKRIEKGLGNEAIQHVLYEPSLSVVYVLEILWLV